MARRPVPPPSPETPSLKLPLVEAESALAERMLLGQDLAASEVRSVADLSALRQQYYTWTEFNAEWLRRFIGSVVADEYLYVGPIFAFGQSSLTDDIRDFREDVTGKIRRLESIKQRLPLWVDEAAQVAASSGQATSDGPIFVVHGSDLGRANEVTRILDRATTRDAVILHEQANAGATVLEKFERHAAEAAFAVVILTADDEGRRRGDDGALVPRGRQNVIFELGFFFGLLERGRVAVLLDPDVEQPSDIHGLVYIALDSAGAWKLALARELESAGIAVNRGRIP